MKFKIYLGIASLFFVQFGFAQTNEKLKPLFYNLPIDSSRAIIRNSIKTDKRFVENQKSKSSATSATDNTYSGSCSNQGLIKIKPDSILMYLRYGSGVVQGSDKLIKTTIIRSKYFFSSLEAAKEEYGKLLEYLKPIAKDSSSSGFADEEGSGEGLYYSLSTEKFKINEIDLAVAYLPAGNFGLFITYTRSEE